MEIGKYLEIKWSFFTKKGANSHEQIKNFGFSRNINNLTVPTLFFNDIKNTMQNKDLCKQKLFLTLSLKQQMLEPCLLTFSNTWAPT